MKSRPYIQALTECELTQTTPIAEYQFIPITKLYNFKAVKKQIMAEAYMAGYNAKSIAAYFKISTDRVYQAIDIKALKIAKINRLYKKMMNEKSH